MWSVLWKYNCLTSYERISVFALRRWSERSPLGQNVDCTTPTSSKCCKLHPCSKVSIIPGDFAWNTICKQQLIVMIINILRICAQKPHIFLFIFFLKQHQQTLTLQYGYNKMQNCVTKQTTTGVGTWDKGQGTYSRCTEMSKKVILMNPVQWLCLLFTSIVTVCGSAILHWWSL